MSKVVVTDLGNSTVLHKATTSVRKKRMHGPDGKVTQGVDAVRGDITVTWVRPAYD